MRVVILTLPRGKSELHLVHYGFWFVGVLRLRVSACGSEKVTTLLFTRNPLMSEELYALIYIKSKTSCTGCT